MPPTSSLQQTLGVRVDVPWEPSWLSWVSATTVCLQTLGLPCDRIDVAGYSGYAFTLSIAPCLDPSGPTAFAWSDLVPGTMALGRSVLLYTSGEGHTRKARAPRSIAHCHAAYEIAAREIEAGRPCVIWGAYAPEFAVVCGVRDGSYLVKSYREPKGEPQPPIPFDEIDAPGPAGPSVFAFPTPRATGSPSCDLDHESLACALARIQAATGTIRGTQGTGAYDLWIVELTRATGVSPMGASYTAQVWAEARYLADQFLYRLIERNSHAAKPLTKAAEAYDEVAAALSTVAKAFPFPGGKDLPDESTRRYATQVLQAAKDAELRAAKSITAALQLPWPRE